MSIRFPLRVSPSQYKDVSNFFQKPFHRVILWAYLIPPSHAKIHITDLTCIVPLTAPAPADKTNILSHGKNIIFFRNS